MLKKFFTLFENIFLIPEEKTVFRRIFLDKTQYYKDDIADFSLDSVYVACEYEENMQKTLKNFKYGYNKSSSDDIICYYDDLKGIFLKDLKNDENILVTGVPIFSLNRMIRGFNQTYMIGQMFSERHGFRFLKLLKKSRMTKKQAKLNRQKRLDNLKGCFKLDSKYNDIIRGKTILLIDDVISTGTTANETGKVLRSAGAEKIIGLFLATGK